MSEKILQQLLEQNKIIITEVKGLKKDVEILKRESAEHTEKIAYNGILMEEMRSIIKARAEKDDAMDIMMSKMDSKIEEIKEEVGIIREVVASHSVVIKKIG